MNRIRTTEMLYPRTAWAVVMRNQAKFISKRSQRKITLRLLSTQIGHAVKSVKAGRAEIDRKIDRKISLSILRPF